MERNLKTPALFAAEPSTAGGKIGILLDVDALFDAANDLDSLPKFGEIVTTLMADRPWVGVACFTDWDVDAAAEGLDFMLKRFASAGFGTMVRKQREVEDGWTDHNAAFLLSGLALLTNPEIADLRVAGADPDLRILGEWALSLGKPLIVAHFPNRVPFLPDALVAKCIFLGDRHLAENDQ